MSYTGSESYDSNREAASTSGLPIAWVLPKHPIRYTGAPRAAPQPLQLEAWPAPTTLLRKLSDPVPIKPTDVRIRCLVLLWSARRAQSQSSHSMSRCFSQRCSPMQHPSRVRSHPSVAHGCSGSYSGRGVRFVTPMAGDLLLRLSQTPARALLRRLGLPTPVVLERGEGVFPKPVLHNESVMLLGSPATDAALPALLTHDLGAGVSTAPDLLAPSERHGAKGNGRPLRLLLDCTSVSTPSDVTRLIMGTFRPALAKVTPNSRIVFLVASNQAAGPLDAALAGGLYSLARSLAKELGMGGTTVNVVRVVRSQASAPLPLAHAAWPIGFLLSPDSCFVSGQQLSVCAPQWRRPADQQDRHQRVALVTGASRGKLPPRLLLY